MVGGVARDTTNAAELVSKRGPIVLVQFENLVLVVGGGTPTGGRGQFSEDEGVEDVGAGFEEEGRGEGGGVGQEEDPHL